ncbi:TetR/AcrR family transcriptional regulator [Streptomyces dysideae]|uniref:HTH tetR-type domain-containing protein n=1 Tax=Streptomyces dysideae TaxID=909626 RepID=A0A101UWX9_9ACTN|nr:TetR/AcrR family transcriptional regulator [Streptomyces dysideae]KUO18402.1 hypothetical protein AQJ91_25540 [Streptomyces dysideae]
MSDEGLSPQQRAAETKRKRTRELIVSGTLDLYDKQTQGEYTLDQIAEASGVGTATIPYHFPTKYDVLKAAYDRLLSPLVDTIIEANNAHIYQPRDGVDELIRYVYTAAKLSHENRALTVGMLKAYFETPPGESHSFGWPLDHGLVIILTQQPFPNGFFSPQGWRASREMLTKISESILTTIYQKTGDGVPEDITYEVCRMLIGVTLHEDRGQELREQIERIKKRV